MHASVQQHLRTRTATPMRSRPLPSSAHCPHPPGPQVLFIDEVSMLSAELLQALDVYLPLVSLLCCTACAAVSLCKPGTPLALQAH